jgi:[ribosomal protein S5]-alanine N-acetyltransferase
MPLSLKLSWPLFGPARVRPRESAPADLCLLGERISLRPLQLTDADGLFLCASDPLVTEFLPWHPATGVESVKNFLHDQIARRRRGESLGLAVLLENILIGSVDLMGLHAARKSGVAEIGYLMNRAHWGQGLMTEAAALARDHGFVQFDLKKLIGFADENNAGSRRVLEKLGMQPTGEEYRTVKSENRRYVRYELTRDDWESRR